MRIHVSLLFDHALPTYVSLYCTTATHRKPLPLRTLPTSHVVVLHHTAHSDVVPLAMLCLFACCTAHPPHSNASPAVLLLYCTAPPHSNVRSGRSPAHQQCCSIGPPLPLPNQESLPTPASTKPGKPPHPPLTCRCSTIELLVYRTPNQLLVYCSAVQQPDNPNVVLHNNPSHLTILLSHLPVLIHVNPIMC